MRAVRGTRKFPDCACSYPVLSIESIAACDGAPQFPHHGSCSKRSHLRARTCANKLAST
jgi:hypothetical protein